MIGKVLKKYPGSKVVTNEKCKNLLKDLLLIDESDFIIVKDRETISLGNKTLEFIFTPWVHWPETMMTYLQEDKILFSCDFLGSHLATSEIVCEGNEMIYNSAKRYYGEIMMPFANHIKKHLDTIDKLSIEYIAPSHGPVYKNPAFIIDAYKEWNSDRVKNQVIIPYVCMHGSTERMVDYIINGLIEKGINVKPFNLVNTDLGELVIELVDSAGLVLASPMLLGGAHPLAVYAAYLANALRPHLKYYTLIGSYGWGGKMLEQVQGIMSNTKCDVLQPVLIKGYPKEDDYKKLDNLIESIYEKHKKIGVINA